MKTLAVVVLSLLGGCGILEQLSSGSGSSYDPTKIYLGDSVVTIAAHDADHYGCVDSVMVCDRLTVAKMICHC